MLVDITAYRINTQGMVAKLNPQGNLDCDARPAAAHIEVLLVGKETSGNAISCLMTRSLFQKSDLSS